MLCSAHQYHHYHHPSIRSRSNLAICIRTISTIGILSSGCQSVSHASRTALITHFTTLCCSCMTLLGLFYWISHYINESACWQVLYDIPITQAGFMYVFVYIVYLCMSVRALTNHYILFAMVNEMRWDVEISEATVTIYCCWCIMLITYVRIVC